MIERAREILNLQIQALQKLPIDQSIERCVEYFVDCKGKIIFCGMGKAGLIGKKIAATCSSLGNPAIYLSPSESLHGDLGIITNSDIIVCLSNSGKTKEILLFLDLCKKTFSCPIIGITGNENAEISNYCDLILSIGKITEACKFNMAPTSSTTAMLVLGDIIALLSSEAKNFTLEEYGRLHHSGYIGDTIREVLKK